MCAECREQQKRYQWEEYDGKRNWSRVPLEEEEKKPAAGLTGFRQRKLMEARYFVVSRKHGRPTS